MAGYLRRVAIAGTRAWGEPGGLRQLVVAGTISPAVSDSTMMPPVAPAEAGSRERTASPIAALPESVRPARPSPPQVAQPAPVRPAVGSRLDFAPSSAIEPEPAPPAASEALVAGEPAPAPLTQAPSAPVSPVLEVSEPAAPLVPGVSESAAPPVPGVSEPSVSAVVQTSPRSMPSLVPASEPSALPSLRASETSAPPAAWASRPSAPSVQDDSVPPAPPVALTSQSRAAVSSQQPASESLRLAGLEGPEPNPAEADDTEADRYGPGISVVRRDAFGRYGAGMIGPRSAAQARVEPRRSDLAPSEALRRVDIGVDTPVSAARPSREQVRAVLSEAVASAPPQHPWQPPTPPLPHKGGGRLAGPAIILPAATTIVPSVAETPSSSQAAPGQNGKRAPADRPTGSPAAEGPGPSRLTARPPPGPAGLAFPTAKSVFAPARATITIGRMEVQVVNRPQRAARDSRQIETPQFQRQAVDPGTLDRFRLLP